MLRKSLLTALLIVAAAVFAYAVLTDRRPECRHEAVVQLFAPLLSDPCF